MEQINTIEIAGYVVDHCLTEQTDLSDAIVLKILASFGFSEQDADVVNEIYGLADHELMNTNDIVASTV